MPNSELCEKLINTYNYIFNLNYKSKKITDPKQIEALETIKKVMRILCDPKGKDLGEDA